MLRRFITGKTIVGRILAVILMQVGIIETLTSMITGFFSRDYAKNHEKRIWGILKSIEEAGSLTKSDVE